MDEMERLLLDHFDARGGGFATARELAVETGHSRRRISWALIRLAGRGKIEVDQVSWISSKGRRRICNSYRKENCCEAIFPAWLMPRAEDVVLGFANHKMRLDVI